jgi:hypothetical protein
MEAQDIVFFALVLYIAWEVFNGGSGGGKRSRFPNLAWQAS